MKFTQQRQDGVNLIRRYGTDFIVVGEHDYPYLIPQANRARDRLRELGATVEHAVVPGNDHAAMVLRFGARDDNVSDRVAAFVNGH